MAENAAVSDGNAEADPEAPPRLGNKKRLIIAAVSLLLLVAAGVAAYLLLGKPHAAKAALAAAAEKDTPETFVDVPPMVINLRSTDGAARLIKLHLMLVPATAEQGPAVTARLPLIIDHFQPFLRELRPEDLAGSAAVFRIKEELLIRANDVTGTGTVKDILIQDLLQQ
ncbi:MAG: flagellar basal body-associated FliL family protein [Tardiphaga sp.]|uniref:flagellar basal body-associated FliL family protein n=1 Tax=Tardiphaga sp. TaxID=1926292 RepID=UPI0019C7FB28|nr:flagellar basal body-associated FliL family protein [Tardiphaga sp.]MBC7583233.1 flagellar basal body-associated FliL family protein [Tardiphaga sp.]